MCRVVGQEKYIFNNHGPQMINQPGEMVAGHVRVRPDWLGFIRFGDRGAELVLLVAGTRGSEKRRPANSQAHLRRADSATPGIR